VEQILLAIAKEVPSLVGIIIVVMMFNKNLDKFIAFISKRDKEFSDIVTKNNSVIEKNSVLYGQNN